MRWKIFAERIGQNIRTIRRVQDLTQEKAAELSGTLSLRHWQYLENGEVNCALNSLTKVARALKLDPQELLAK